MTNMTEFHGCNMHAEYTPCPNLAIESRRTKAILSFAMQTWPGDVLMYEQPSSLQDSRYSISN
jgi:hypothetical protein